MVCGLFVSIVLMEVVIKTFSTLFKLFVANEATQHVLGLPSAVAFIIIYVGMILIYSHRIFGITLHLPQKVLNWIGAGIHEISELHDEERTRSQYVMMGNRFEGGLGKGIGIKSSGDGIKSSGDNVGKKK